MDFGEMLVAITGIVMVGAVILLPVFALTARFVLRPMMDSWLAIKRVPANGYPDGLMERRISALESQVEALEQDCTRLKQEADFQMKLHG